MDYNSPVYKVIVFISGAIFLYFYYMLFGSAIFNSPLLTLTIYLIVATVTFPFAASIVGEKLYKQYFLRSFIFIFIYIFAPFIFITMLVFKNGTYTNKKDRG